MKMCGYSVFKLIPAHFYGVIILIVEMLLIESGDLIHGDYVKLVVEVAMRGSFHSQHLLVIPFELGESVLSEVI